MEEVTVSGAPVPGGGHEANDTDPFVSIVEKHGFARQLRRVYFYFVFGCIVYLGAWSPILCRIARGVVRYPDRMPLPVWISTIGLLFLYETFILAQCTSMTTRITTSLERLRAEFKKKLEDMNSEDMDGDGTATRKSVLSVLWDDMKCMDHREKVILFMLFVVSLPSGFSIVVISAGVSIDLVCAVLFAVPSIRDMFGMQSDKSRAEPWAILCMLFFVWLIVVFVTLRIEKQRIKNLKRKDDGCPEDEGLIHWLSGTGNMNVLSGFIVYVLLGVSFFFFWGFVVMPSSLVETDTQWPWILLLVVLMSAVTATMCWGGLTAIMHTPENQDRSKKMAIEEQSQQLEEDNANNNINELLTGFASSHYHACLFHVGLILFAFFIGFANKDLSFWSEYVTMSQPTYFYTADWQQLSDARDNATLKASLGLNKNGKIPINLCASKNNLPIFTLLCSIGWSLCSATQHFISAKTLTPGACRWLQLDSHSVRQLTLLATAAFSIPAVIRIEPAWYAAIPFVLLIYLLMFPLVWVCLMGVSDLFRFVDQHRLPDKPKFHEAHNAVKQVRLYKLIEYTFSATLMHVIVLVIAGITSSHELVLAAMLLAISMVQIICMEHEMDQLEDTVASKPKSSAVDLETRIECEKPFIQLSFFAKGVLCLALTVPFIWIDRQEFQVSPVECS